MVAGLRILIANLGFPQCVLGGAGHENVCRWPTSGRLRFNRVMLLRRRKRNLRSGVLQGALCPAALVFLAACGGGGGTTPPTDGDNPPPPPAGKADFRDEIVYQLLTDRFANGDPANDNGLLDRAGDTADPTSPVGWHGGDFAGIEAKLKEGYFQRMGFTAVWISPVVLQVPPPGNGGGVNAARPFVGFHGYWTDRFDAIEPHFGNLAALQALGTAADTAGVKLIVDVVVNHAGPGSVLVTQNPSWFRTGAACGSDEVTMCLAGLPDFRQELPEVSDFLLGTISFLRDNAAIDGLRMDTMKHVGDPFWSRFFGATSPADASKLWTVGEVFSGDVSRIAHYLDTVGSPAVFDFPLKFALVDSLASGGSTRQLAEIFAQDSRYADPTRLATFLDNHDAWRFTSEAEASGATPALADRRLMLALTVLYLVRGTPVVYYGTEIAMRGEGDSYDKPLGASSREDMDFTQLTASSLDERLKALADARRQYAALRRGRQQTLFAPGRDCRPPASTLDPTADFGDTLYARGSFDGWSSPPPDAQRFVNLGGRQYQADFELPAARHEYKVAAADWSPEFARTDADTLLDVPITLAPASGAGSNGRILITETGCHRFALDATSTANPVLTVSRRGDGDPDVLVLVRTLAGSRTVLVVVNNQDADADLTALPGGGVDLQGLFADSMLLEVTGSSHGLQVSGGRLRGVVAALTALGLAAP